MNSGSIVVIVWLLFVAIGGLVYWWKRHVDKLRRRDLEKLASDLGLPHTDLLSSADDAQFQQFKLSQLGHSRQVSNVIVADSGELRIVVFDFRYTVGSGKNQSTKVQSVVLASAIDLRLPTFSLSPESFFQRFAEIFGKKDIDFEEDSRFSKQFLLHGESETSVRAFFTAERRHKLLEFSNINIEGLGNTFLFYVSGTRCRVEELKDWIGKALSLYSMLRSPPTL